MDIIFESSHAIIQVNTQFRFFNLKLKGVIDENEYKNAFNELLKTSIDLKYNKLLVNLLNLELSDAKSRAWLISNFSIEVFDRVPNVKIATVKSKSYFQELVFKVIQTTLRKNYIGLDMELFLDYDSAFEWLTSE